jgi:hypothetical protein
MLYNLFALFIVWFFAILLVRRRTCVRLLLHDLTVSNVTSDFAFSVDMGEPAFEFSFFYDVSVASL